MQRAVAEEPQFSIWLRLTADCWMVTQHTGLNHVKKQLSWKHYVQNVSNKLLHNWHNLCDCLLFKNHFVHMHDEAIMYTMLTHLRHLKFMFNAYFHMALVPLKYCKFSFNGEPNAKYSQMFKSVINVLGSHQITINRVNKCTRNRSVSCHGLLCTVHVQLYSTITVHICTVLTGSLSMIEVRLCIRYCL